MNGLWRQINLDSNPDSDIHQLCDREQVLSFYQSIFSSQKYVHELADVTQAKVWGTITHSVQKKIYIYSSFYLIISMQQNKKVFVDKLLECDSKGKEKDTHKLKIQRWLFFSLYLIQSLFFQWHLCLPVLYVVGVLANYFFQSVTSLRVEIFLY